MCQRRCSIAVQFLKLTRPRRFQLAFANSNIDPLCDNLAEGEVCSTSVQVLCRYTLTLLLKPLCLGITGQDCTTTHVIQSGDLCTTIAQTAGIDESVLLANNRNVNNVCSNIYPGEVSNPVAFARIAATHRLDEVLCTASTIIPYSS